MRTSPSSFPVLPLLVFATVILFVLAMLLMLAQIQPLLPVAKGQVIGTLGDTGRTNGAHFHWEVAVNGDWVDSVQFMEMWQP